MMHCIADTDWSKRTPLGMGGYAVVYRVAPGVVAFVMGFLQGLTVGQQLGHCWDARPANVARYRGNLVALDFGEEEEFL